MGLLKLDETIASGTAAFRGHSENAVLVVDMMSSAELEVANLRRLGRKVPCLLFFFWRFVIKYFIIYSQRYMNTFADHITGA